MQGVRGADNLSFYSQASQSRRAATKVLHLEAPSASGSDAHPELTDFGPDATVEHYFESSGREGVWEGR